MDSPLVLNEKGGFVEDRSCLLKGSGLHTQRNATQYLRRTQEFGQQLKCHRQYWRRNVPVVGANFEIVFARRNIQCVDDVPLAAQIPSIVGRQQTRASGSGNIEDNIWLNWFCS